ncbi:MAG: hypothetical protein CO093_05320 [Alphaproteobacteria bacterium CG_4_9_14_3_um_filter_47_13]|nr:MAG: hypothetical protein CO093_05320 [Alphaproteobacteria bacterium CG_4_9_14_3_um_filter_47_13]
MGALIYQWIDLIWLPIGWFAVPKQHRFKTLAFIITCILTLRTQVELVESTGFNTGFLPFLDTPVYMRGLIIYSILIAFFLVLAHFSAATHKIVFLTASLAIFFFAFMVSMVVMVL